MLGYPAVTVGAVAMFLATLGAPQDGLCFTGNRLVTYLGKISYGLYVFHSLALLLVWECLTHVRQDVTGRGAIILLAFALTVALGALSYRFLKLPCCA
jgi:peptidoglycan/LPS O-acetylase OafA/YrhL